MLNHFRSRKPKLLLFVRNIYSKTKTWPKDWNSQVRKSIEEYWKPILKAKHAESSRQITENKQKYYVLSMFPYPSGKLHMGHVRVYTISDTMARYHRLKGKYVIHPMGWDAFGLPAENAAIDRGELPDAWTNSNIEMMREQLEQLCYSFDWDREYATCDPKYYKWTEYLFLKMYEHGLVYQREGPVNWDPVDKTVLADEQIDENGCSWRSGAKVECRFLKQWYIRTTAYSKSLLDGLQEVDPDLWRDIIALQENWIGECNGQRFEFSVVLDGETLDSPLSVFTSHPQCVYGMSHMLLSPEHFFSDAKYYKEGQESSSDVIKLKVMVHNPFTNENIPVFIHRKYDFGENIDSYMAIPSVSEEDRTFCSEHNIIYREVLDPNSNLINSDSISGLNTEDSCKSISKLAKNLNCGGYITSKKSRDWLISRQRYWGTPIPVIHCTNCGTVPVPYKDLPVELPKSEEFSGKGSSPLVAAHDWLNVKCPKCNCDARRETDTMDTFVDSSWYYLRYLDTENIAEPFSKEAAHNYMPVDLYIGGKEHAIMHLYYARFFHHFLHDLGLTPTREPFTNLLTQGMVMGQSYRVKDTGKYLRHDEIDFSENPPVEKDTGAKLTISWEKMSKSKYNGVDPQDVLDRYGADATRLSILAAVAPKSDRNWSDSVFVGIDRWQKRIWDLVAEFIEEKLSPSECEYDAANIQAFEESIFDTRNYFLKEVNHHLEKSFLLSTAISRMQGLNNDLRRIPKTFVGHSYQYERALAESVIMIAPFAPMFASELWEGLKGVCAHTKKTNLDWNKSVLEQNWPEVDADYKVKLKVKLNGRDAFEVKQVVPLSEVHKLSTEEALSIVQNCEQYDATVKGYTPQKVRLDVVPMVRAELHLRVDELDKKKAKKLRHKKKNKTDTIKAQNSCS